MGYAYENDPKSFSECPINHCLDTVHPGWVDSVVSGEEVMGPCNGNTYRLRESTPECEREACKLKCYCDISGGNAEMNTL